MKLSVNSEETTAFRVSIDMTEQEKADFLQEGIVTFSLCIARLIGELVQDSCDSTAQAKALSSIITKMSKDMVDEYIDDIFDEVKQIREEAKLYSYMEDMFEVPEYPYFGYQRGRYTKAELKEVVAYGKRFGITLNPSMQVLGHLEMPLIWPAFKDIKDSSAVLYVGKPEVYEFIDKLFKNLCRLSH